MDTTLHDWLSLSKMSKELFDQPLFAARNQDTGQFFNYATQEEINLVEDKKQKDDDGRNLQYIKA
jgi:hypothetical protein